MAKSKGYTHIENPETESFEGFQRMVSVACEMFADKYTMVISHKQSPGLSKGLLYSLEINVVAGSFDECVEIIKEFRRKAFSNGKK